MSVDPAGLIPRRGHGTRIAAADPAAAGGALRTVGCRLLVATPLRANAVLSPYSVFVVLAMAAVGARRRTAEQLRAFLGEIGGDDRAAQLAAVDGAIADAMVRGAPATGDPRYHDSRPMALRGANALFVSSGSVIRRPFLDALVHGFGAGPWQLDYAADPERARGAINSWVSERTNAKIDELLARGSVTQDTVLTLVNAVHLTAPWRSPFRRSANQSPFRTADGATVGVNQLRTTAWYVHRSGDGWISVTIPYRGGGLAMTIVLPEYGLFDVIRQALPDVLAIALRPTRSSSAAEGGVVDLSLPGFTLDIRMSWAEQLRRAGVGDLFDPAAVDLSGIAGLPGDLVATELTHRAVITVDKDGTEAAAATAMSMSATGAPVDPVRIVVDRSFLFAVHDTLTGAPLFIGQLIDPTPVRAAQPAQGPMACPQARIS